VWTDAQRASACVRRLVRAGERASESGTVTLHSRARVGSGVSGAIVGWRLTAQLQTWARSDGVRGGAAAGGQPGAAEEHERVVGGEGLRGRPARRAQAPCPNLLHSMQPHIPSSCAFQTDLESGSRRLLLWGAHTRGLGSYWIPCSSS
jgi:hypothetical protein